MEKMSEADQAKEVICITSVGLVNDVMDHMSENEGQFKKALLFELNESASPDMTLMDDYPDFLFERTNRVFKLAQLLNEVHSHLYHEMVKDGPTREKIKYQSKIEENSDSDY